MSVACPEDVTERNATNNTATASDPIYSIIFIDGFESGDTEAWAE